MQQNRILLVNTETRRLDFMADSLVVGSKVKDAVKNGDCNMAGDFPDALSKAVEAIVKKACDRAKANSRKTGRPEDI